MRLYVFIQGFTVLVNFFVTSAFVSCKSRIKPTREQKTKIASEITDALFESYQSYQSALENAGLLTDILTASSINTISDSVAQFLSLGEQDNGKVSDIKAESDNDKRKENLGSFSSTSISSMLQEPGSSIVPFAISYDAPRTLRLALFGLADGAVSHVWFIALDSVVGEGQGLIDTLIKTAADALVYTPLWCAWFLAFMTSIEPLSSSSNTGLQTNDNDSIANRIQSIPTIWKSDWFELLKGNLGFFLPLTGLIYGFVPREERVLAFGVASLIYTTILSLWNKSRQDNTNVIDALPIMDMELCDIDDEKMNDECVPVPTPARFILQYRIRRVMVRARRRILR